MFNPSESPGPPTLQKAYISTTSNGFQEFGNIKILFVKKILILMQILKKSFEALCNIKTLNKSEDG